MAVTPPFGGLFYPYGTLPLKVSRDCTRQVQWPYPVRVVE
jgi:hypothetical protein